MLFYTGHEDARQKKTFEEEWTPRCVCVCVCVCVRKFVCFAVFASKYIVVGPTRSTKLTIFMSQGVLHAFYRDNGFH